MKNENKKLEILVAYRENDSFKEYVPVIEKTLESLNYKIERKMFPKKTSEESIEKWFIANSEKIKKYGLRLTDNTVYSSIEEIEEDIWPNRCNRISTNIDNLLREATINMILEQDIKGVYNTRIREGISNYVRNLKNAYVNTINKVIKKPKEVIIIRENIASHEFGYLDCVGKEEEAASILKGFFKEAGIPKVTIVGCSEAITREIEKNKKNIWIIKDRHLINTNFKERGFIELKTPITDFYDSVEEYDLFASGAFKKEKIALELKNLIKSKPIEETD